MPAVEANGRVTERWLEDTSDWQKLQNVQRNREGSINSSHLAVEREYVKKAVHRERGKAKRDSKDWGENLASQIEEDFLYQWGPNWLEWTIEQLCEEDDDACGDNELEATLEDHRPSGYDPRVPVHVQPGHENRWLSSVEDRVVSTDDPEELDVPDCWFPRKYWCRDDDCQGKIKRVFVIPLDNGDFARLPAPHIHCTKCKKAWPGWMRYRPFDLLAWTHQEMPEPMCGGCVEEWLRERKK